MIHKENVHADDVFTAAYGLVGENGVIDWTANPEYGRAIKELVRDLLGLDSTGEAEVFIGRYGPPPQPTYKIVRFYADERPSVVHLTGLSLAEAQEHCRNESSHQPGEWFDGYEQES